MANTGNVFDPATDEIGTINTDTGDWTSSTAASVIAALSPNIAAATATGTDSVGAAIAIGDVVSTYPNGQTVNFTALMAGAAPTAQQNVDAIQADAAANADLAAGLLSTGNAGFANQLFIADADNKINLNPADPDSP